MTRSEQPQTKPKNKTKKTPKTQKNNQNMVKLELETIKNHQ